MAERYGITDALAQILIIMAIIASVIVLSQTAVVTSGLALPTILTDMPTFYEYNKDGSLRQTHESCLETHDALQGCEVLRCGPGDSNRAGCVDKPSNLIKYYWMLAGIGAVIIVVAVFYAVLMYLMEDTGLVTKGKAANMMREIPPVIIIILIIPFVWDPAALFIETSALYLMAPFPAEEEPYINIGVVQAFMNTTEPMNHAQVRGAWLLMEAGNIIPPSVWQPEALTGFIFDPAKAVSNVLSTAFLGIFKAVAVLILMLNLWITGIVRVVLTMIVVMAMPVMKPLALIDKFKAPTEQITKGLAGLMLAPIFSALVFTIGVSYLAANPHPDLTIRWLYSLTVAFLCSSSVGMIAGGLLTGVSGQISGALMTAATAGSVAAGAVATGGISAVANLRGSSGKMGGALRNLNAVAGKMRGGGSGLGGGSGNEPNSAEDTGKLGRGGSGNQNSRQPRNHTILTPDQQPDSTQAAPGPSHYDPSLGVQAPYATHAGGMPDAPDASGSAPGTVLGGQSRGVDEFAGTGADSGTEYGGTEARQESPAVKQDGTATRSEPTVEDDKSETDSDELGEPTGRDLATAFIGGALAKSMGPIVGGVVPGKMGLDKIAGEFDSRGAKMAQDLAERKAKLYEEKEQEYKEETKNVKKKIQEKAKVKEARANEKRLEAEAKAAREKSDEEAAATGMYR